MKRERLKHEVHNHYSLFQWFCYYPVPLIEHPIKIERVTNKPYFRKGERW